MKIIALTIVTFLVCLSCNNNARENNVLDEQQKEFEHAIDSLGIRVAHEDVKWILYCIYCDDTAKIKTGDSVINYHVTYGELPFKITHLSYLYTGTIVGSYAFYYDDTVELDYTGVKEWVIVNGAGYKQNQDTLAYLFTRHGNISNVSCDSPMYTRATCPIREVNPIQPAVVKYINDNQHKIDPWFRKEAVRRGVLKE